MPTAGHPLPPTAVTTALPVTKLANGRVSLHFTPQARAAVEEAFSKPRASDSSAVSHALDAGAPSTEQKPLGS